MSAVTLSLSQASGEPCPDQGVLHACRERAAQLEVWLEGARQSLATPVLAAAMQDSVEQQLFNCQVSKEGSKFSSMEHITGGAVFV